MKAVIVVKYVSYSLLTSLCLLDVIFKGVINPFFIPALWLLIAWVEFSSDPRRMIFFFYGWYYFFGCFLSAIFIANGAYMTEVSQIGTNNGLIGLAGLSFLVVWSGFKKGFSVKLDFFSTKLKTSITYRQVRAIIYGVLCCLFFLMLVVLLNYSSPILLGLSRTQFFNQIPGAWGYLPITVFVSIFLVACCFWINKNKTLPVIIIISLFAVNFFVLGQKFSGFIALLPGLLIPYAVYSKRIGINLKSILFFAIFLATCFLAILYMYGRGGGNAWQHIIVRAALQSQVSWSFMNETTHFLYGPLASVPFYEMIDAVGFRYTSYQFYLAHSDAGLTLTGYFPALFLLKLGIIPTVIVSWLLAFLIGLVSSFLREQLRYGNIIISFLIYLFYTKLLLLLIANSFFGALSFFVFFVFLMCVVIYSLGKKRLGYDHFYEE